MIRLWNFFKITHTMKTINFKHLLTSLIAMLVSVNVNATVFSGPCGKDVSWTYDTSTTELHIRGKGEMNDLVPWSIWQSNITKMVIEEGVTSIANNSFYSFLKLSSIDLPASLTSIGSYAFYGCSSLTSLTIPSSVTSIGYSAFSGCKNLASINLPLGIVDIEGYAFNGCTSLTTLNIPSSVRTIGDSAFQGCTSLTSFTIPSGVTSLGTRVFSGCVGEITIECDIPNWTNSNTPFGGSKFTSVNIRCASIGNYAFYGCSTIENCTFPEDLSYIGKYAFSGCTGLTEVNLPESVDYVGVSAFSGCTGIVRPVYNSKLFVMCPKTHEGTCEMPNSIQTICENAFSGCDKITSIELPSQLKNIGRFAFSSCKGLTTLTLPNSLKTIGDNAFMGCEALQTVIVPESVTSVGEGIFEYCDNLTSPIYNSTHFFRLPTSYSGSYEIPDGITNICNGAFGQCMNLTALSVPESVVHVDKIGYCPGLTVPVFNSKLFIKGVSTYSGTYSIPDGIQEICDGAFTNCDKYTLIHMPNTVKRIGNEAFGWCYGLTSFTVSNNVTEIGDGAFRRCLELNSITLPSTVRSIGENAFEDCTKLDKITIPSGVTSIGQGTFRSCSGLTSISLPATITYIGNYAFGGCSGLNALSLPANVETIGDSAFDGCSGLTSLSIPASVETIGNYAFNGCSGLTSLSIPANVTSIGKSAFRGCTGEITIQCDLPDYRSSSDSPLSDSQFSSAIIKSKRIGKFAFYSRSSLKSVELPDGLEYIGGSAFYGCSGLTSVTIPSGVTAIGDRAFTNCTGLSSLIIPSSVTSIGAGAFINCSGLTSLTLPSGLTTIEESTFSGCSGLTSLTLPPGVTTIKNNAFYYCKSLTEIKLNDGLTYIGNNAFYVEERKKTVDIIWPSSITHVGKDAFYTMPLRSNCRVYITDIKSWCNLNFMNEYSSPLVNTEQSLHVNGNTISDLEIPNNVKTIGNYAFVFNKDIVSLTLHENVAAIGEMAFYRCENLKTVKSHIKTPYDLDDSVFKSISSDAILYVPAGTKDMYESATGWSDNFTDIIEFEEEKDYLKTNDISICKGNRGMMIVALNNVSAITAAQFELSLPEGVAVSSAVLTERKNNHSVDFSQLSNGNYQFVVFSSSSKPIIGTEGGLVEISLAVSENISSGEYDVLLQNIELTTMEGEAINPSNYVSTLTVTDIAPGDANGDGKISITDAVGIVNYILGNPSSNFHSEAADVNGDGKVSITDAVGVVNMILNQGSSNVKAVTSIEVPSDPQ